MKKYKVSGFYTITKYVDRVVIAENEDEAKYRAWGDYYETETESGEGFGEFEITEEPVEITD